MYSILTFLQLFGTLPYSGQREIRMSIPPRKNDQKQGFPFQPRLPQPGSKEFDEHVSWILGKFPQLSPMQAAVIYGVWGGLHDHEAAAWLGRATSTVHQHIEAARGRISPDGRKVRRATLVRAVELALGAREE